MKKAIIISGNLAQDHEFIYPYYRLLEAGFDVDVCLLEGKPVRVFWEQHCLQIEIKWLKRLIKLKLVIIKF